MLSTKSFLLMLSTKSFVFMLSNKSFLLCNLPNLFYFMLSTKSFLFILSTKSFLATKPFLFMLSTKYFLLCYLLNLSGHFSGDLLLWKVASHNSLISMPQRRYIYYPLMFAFPFVIYWDSLLLKSFILLDHSLISVYS